VVVRQLEGVVPHHMIIADADEIIAQVPALKGPPRDIVGRACCAGAPPFSPSNA